MTDKLIHAAITLAWNEGGTKAALLGLPGAADIYERWPAMDALLAALDDARPGWRTQPPEGFTVTQTEAGWVVADESDSWTDEADGTSSPHSDPVATEVQAVALAWGVVGAMLEEYGEEADG